MSDHQNFIRGLIEKHQPQLLTDWLACLARSGVSGAGVHRDDDTSDQAKRFIEQLRMGVRNGQLSDISASDWAPMRELLEDISRSRASQGISSTDTATFVFSFKEPLFELLRCNIQNDADRLARETWLATRLLDQLGLFTVDCYQRTREELIGRQQQELLELSTPVVQLWDGILALPLIGTLDSARTQIVMESLLQRIVTSGAEIAIIDITGVPTVDTLVAQHLIKTISAARLMGADCILSGIRPQIAQTIVHLGLELNVISKATMADALKLALHRTRKTIVTRAATPSQEA
jgi:rsbT co-antagonist protein RsbR